MTRGLGACFLALLPLSALAEGCPPPDGVTLPVLEAMNQQILDQSFGPFAASIQRTIGNDIAPQLDPIRELFAEGFTGCRTLVQRRDTGGLVQEVVMFEGKVGPLFLYWRAVHAEGADDRVLTFNLNTDIEDVMSSLH